MNSLQMDASIDSAIQSINLALKRDNKHQNEVFHIIKDGCNGS